jgi:hypothetical protein
MFRTQFRDNLFAHIRLWITLHGYYTLPRPRGLLGMLAQEVTSLASTQESHYSSLDCGNDLLD